MKIQRLSIPIIIGLSLTAFLLLGAGTAAQAAGRLYEATQPQAAIRHVAPSGSDTGDCSDNSAPCQTIQYAVDQAAAGDEIWIASLDNSSVARYTSTATNVVTLNKSLTLRGGYIYAHGFSYNAWTPGLIPAPLDGEHARRALHISGGVTPSLALLAFVNGHADRGGNIYAEDSSPRFVATPVMSGTATYGGGIYLKNCQVSFDPGDLDWESLLGIGGLLPVWNNTATYGGGIYVEGGVPILAGLAVYTNTATADGGGVYLQEGHPAVVGGVVLENRAGNRGGGFFLQDSAASIAGTAVYSNTAADGAGFYLDGPFTLSPLDIPIIANNYVRHNRTVGSQGGGFYFRQAIAGLVNNVVADNQAADGAAMYLWASSPQLYHNTIAQNTGGSGIYLTHKPGSLWPPVIPIPSLPSFTNTIVASHTVGIYVDSTGLPYPLENRATLDGALWWGNGSDGAGTGQIVRHNDVTGDPRFTCTGGLPDCLLPYHILTDSAALDAGVSPGLEILVDIDGQLRPSGDGYDIGADEVVSESYSAWFIPPLSVLVARPGQSVTHTHRLMNTGLEADTYDLELGSSAGWSVLQTSSPITLGAQASATVQVRAMAPSTATNGMRDTTIITATSRAAPERRAIALEVTQVFTGVQADLAVGKWADAEAIEPGGAARFTVVITNAGPLTMALPIVLTDTAVPTQAIQSWLLPPGCAGAAETGRFVCALVLPAGAPPITHSLSIVITTTETYTGLLVNTVTAGGTQSDPDPTNNTAQAVIAIYTPPQDNLIYLPLITHNATYTLPPPLPPPVPVSATPPIDFESIRAGLQANGQDLAFVKIGFHAGLELTTGLTVTLSQLDAAGVPFFLKTVDNAQPVFIAQELMKSSGVSHTLVYRRSGNEFDVPNYYTSPQQAAQDHWNLHKSVFPPELDPSLVWIETVNEVDKNRSEWLAEFALETAQLALNDEFRWAAFGWSSGEPEPEHWDSPKMLEFLQLAADNPDRIAIALHEYSYETGDIGRWYPALVGRFQALFQICDQHRIPRPTVLITEWGWTHNNIPSVSAAMDDIAWASWLYAAYPQVKGAAIWYLGPGYGDIARQVEQLIVPWGEYARSNYFIIEQGQGRVDPELFRP